MAVTLLWAAGAKNILIKNHGLLHAQITCCKNYSFPSTIKDNLSYLEQVLRNNINSSEECFSPNDKIL